MFWQLFVLFACCAGVGRALRFFISKEFSLLNKVLFSLMGGLFLVVLTVCRALEEIKSMRMLVFETNPWLTRWLWVASQTGKHQETLQAS
jgi:hypothetical protein